LYNKNQFKLHELCSTRRGAEIKKLLKSDDTLVVDRKCMENACSFANNKAIYDILNQNKNIRRNVTETYIEDIRTQTLTRYLLLTFTYNLRQFQQPGTLQFM
jgi:hypothetical protein